jgi:protein TonB
MNKKLPSVDLKLSYPLIMEAGIIMTLLLLIAASKISFPETENNRSILIDTEEVALILPPVTSNTEKTVNPPKKPTIPIEIPNDTPIEVPDIELNEFQRVARYMVPPLPQEISVESNLHLFEGIDQPPQMIGGEDAFRNSIEYPIIAQRSGIQGIVEVEFTVNKNGRVSDPVIVKGIGAGCDKAVLKAIKMQRFKPGIKNGELSLFKIKETVQFILLGT